MLDSASMDGWASLGLPLCTSARQVREVALLPVPTVFLAIAVPLLSRFAMAGGAPSLRQCRSGKANVGIPPSGEGVRKER
ncbi:MAG: hypothetical protein V3S25_10050, partial [Nitrospirales bacterium]